MRSGHRATLAARSDSIDRINAAPRQHPTISITWRNHDRRCPHRTRRFAYGPPCRPYASPTALLRSPGRRHPGRHSRARLHPGPPPAGRGSGRRSLLGRRRASRRTPRHRELAAQFEDLLPAPAGQQVLPDHLPGRRPADGLPGVPGGPAAAPAAPPAPPPRPPTSEPHPHRAARS
ncbi:hypothetical protein DLE60_03090, partial [Micromonospora globispora]